MLLGGPVWAAGGGGGRVVDRRRWTPLAEMSPATSPSGPTTGSEPGLRTGTKGDGGCLLLRSTAEEPSAATYEDGQSSVTYGLAEVPHREAAGARQRQQRTRLVRG
jgi:hypothetical protein